jgi:AP-4 complex subunit beta-1
MIINTFIKDCGSSDFQIRGKALKTLCLLQTEDALYYAKKEIMKGLKDINPYVKKIAIICCLKLYYQDKSFFEE